MATDCKGGAAVDPVAFSIAEVRGATSSAEGGGGYFCPRAQERPGFPHAQRDFSPIVVTQPGKFTDDQFTTNWDKEFGGRDHLAFRIFWADSDTFQPFGADFSGSRPAAYPRQIT